MELMLSNLKSIVNNVVMPEIENETPWHIFSMNNTELFGYVGQMYAISYTLKRK